MAPVSPRVILKFGFIALAFFLSLERVHGKNKLKKLQHKKTPLPAMQTAFYSFSIPKLQFSLYRRYFQQEGLKYILEFKNMVLEETVYGIF